MNDMPNKTTEPSHDVDAGRAPSVSRRRFLKAGTATAPVVATLLSQPALGTTTCFTPSRSLSRNTSIRSSDGHGNCTGAPCTHYQNNPGGSGWPSGCSPTTSFHNDSYRFCGTRCWTSGWPSRSKTMIEVFNTADDCSRHFAAAYLNCLGGGGSSVPSSVMTHTRVLQMWRDCETTGRHEITAGVYWDREQCKAYFRAQGIVG